jgi:hypothetical protein
MMGTLGSRLDSWLLAEGVETRAELDTLVRLGVPLVQGFHLARPGPAWVGVDDETALHLLMSGRHTTGTTLRSLLSEALSSESVDTGLRFNVDTGIAEAAMRAVTRPTSARGAPLVCVDNAGRFVGIVGMEALVKSLAQHVVEGTGPAQPRLGFAA